MNKRNSSKEIIIPKKIMINGALFLGLILLTFYIVFKNNEVDDVVRTLLTVDKRYIFVGMICMCIFATCEALNIRRSLNLFGYNIGFLTCVKYALVGNFFSSVTPSASGGQPMQVYFMHKDNIHIGHATLALLMDLASYQLVTVSMAIIGMITHFHLLSESLGSIKIVLIIGVTINVLVLLLLLIAIFSNKILNNILEIITKVLLLFKYKKIDDFRKKVLDISAEYKKSSVYFKKNKSTVIKIVLTTIVQMTVMNSIPFWIYKSFGLDTYSIGSVIALQSILFVAVSSLPLPGGVGISESGFMIIFKTLFPTQILSSAMLLSRGISFYLWILITGSVIALTCVVDIRDRNTIKHEKVGVKSSEL